MKKILFLLALPFVLAACQQGGTQASDVSGTLDQDNICLVKSTDTAQPSECHIGQKIAFLPGSWGSDQFPMVFVANNCDMRYSVALTNGGVVCIFKPNKNEITSS